MAEFTETISYSVMCPSCKGGHILKHGQQNGQQRFKCQSCNKAFRNNGKVEGRKFDSEQIGIAVRLYYGGTSYQQLAEAFRDFFGINLPSKETFYRWVTEYTNKASYILKDVKAHTGDKWVADEMYVKVGGRMLYHWNVMDAKTRFLLASHLDVNRDQAAAAKVLQKALAKADHPPTRIYTDKWVAYPGAIRKLVPGVKHIQSKGIHHYINNNLSERMQGTFRSREKVLRGMTTIESGQRFLDGFVIQYNHFRDHSGIKARTPAEAAKINVPLTEWADVVRSEAVVPPEARTSRPVRIRNFEPLPRDITERKRLQRRKRRADRKAELEARKKKPKESDGSVAMINEKTLRPTAEFRRAKRNAKAEYGKAGQLHRSKVTAPKPLMPELVSFKHKSASSPTHPFGKPALPGSRRTRPKPPINHQARLF